MKKSNTALVALMMAMAPSWAHMARTVRVLQEVIGECVAVERALKAIDRVQSLGARGRDRELQRV